jgi:hypothetical protein
MASAIRRLNAVSVLWNYQTKLESQFIQFLQLVLTVDVSRDIQGRIYLTTHEQENCRTSSNHLLEWEAEAQAQLE